VQHADSEKQQKEENMLGINTKKEKRWAGSSAW